MQNVAWKHDLVFLLLGEVETIGMARPGTLSESEPGDAVRVVNALLQGIDRMGPLQNVVMTATTNLLNALDSAFRDRADMLLKLDEPRGETRSSERTRPDSREQIVTTPRSTLPLSYNSPRIR